MKIEARVHGDDTTRLSLRLADGALVECVIITAPERGRGRRRRTLCLSTQVGCRMGCVFCATGRMGFQRQLAAEEIAGQVRAAMDESGGRPDSIVFMGMGEPLDNFDAWHAAVGLLIGSRRTAAGPPLAYSTHRMTVSTCGHVPGLERLAAGFFRKMTVAVSLNASNDEVRSSLMPVGRRWPMATLRQALERLPLRNRIVLVEYVVFPGVNDRPEHACELAAYLEPFRPLINLIGYNPGREGPVAGLAVPSDEDLRAFRERLTAEGLFARLRESKGRSIHAACGQLATACAGTGTARDATTGAAT
jgi:23S rRNA (adenine2503-C2)-methyltransferase